MNGLRFLAVALWPALEKSQIDVTPPQAPAHEYEAELDARLLIARRIFVDNFGDDAINKSLHAIVIDSIRSGKRFIVTENRARADLILKGTALEKTSQEMHALGSATSAAGTVGDGVLKLAVLRPGIRGQFRAPAEEDSGLELQGLTTHKQ